MSTLRVDTLTDLAGVPYGFGSGSFEFISGTTLLFHQASAPPGWLQITTHNDKALRVVSGTGGGSGGTGGAFSSVFASRTFTGTVGDTTLTIDQIPSHSHGVPDANQNAGFGGNSFDTGGNAAFQYIPTTSEGGGLPHTHSLTGTAMDFAVQYIDLIIASKV